MRQITTIFHIFAPSLFHTLKILLVSLQEVDKKLTNSFTYTNMIGVGEK